VSIFSDSWTMKVRLQKKLKRKINCSRDVFEIIHKVFMRQNKLHRQREYFWVIGLDTANHILYIELIAISNLNQVMPNIL
jgi:hypothetical protein